ncbi:MAG: HAD family hydrolase [Treponema sp.]|nr:HAD family hydrolase [Treponema sp.]
MIHTNACSLAVFDLDGTILDTLSDLAASINFALEAHRLERRTTDEVRQFVGNGIRNLVVRAVCASCGTAVTERMDGILVCAPADSGRVPKALLDAVHTSFTEHYRIHCADSTCPYAGIPEVLSTLRSHGIKTAVVSNKADYGVQALCARYFPGLFDYAVGERDGIRRKPAPDSVLHVMQEFDAPASSTVYIGDSDVDIATARNAGVRCLSVTWGFRDEQFLLKNGATELIRTTNELLTALLQAD